MIRTLQGLFFSVFAFATLLGLTTTGAATVSTTPPHSTGIKPVKIGVLAYRGADTTLSMWRPTAHYLNQMIPSREFIIVPLTLDTIGSALAKQSVDFILTNPASYAELEYQYGISRIATLINNGNGNAHTQFGGVIFTRNDRKDINTLTDLHGKSVMAVHRNAFGGWWMAWRELAEAGIDPYRDLKTVQYSGFPQGRVVSAVLSGKVDAGTVRTGLLEQLAANGKISLDNIKIINQKHNVAFPFLHSTTLYPEWPFATTKTTSKLLARQVINALLRLRPDSPAAIAAGIVGWTIPLDYQPVHELMRTLRVGPYQFLPETNQSILSLYWHWLVSGFAIILIMGGLTTYFYTLNIKLKRSTQRLAKEVQERKAAQNNSQEQSRRLNALYEISSVSKLSFNEQLTEVLKAGCSIFDTEIGRICQINTVENTSTTIAVHAPENFDVKPGNQVPLDKTFCRIPFTNREPIALHNVGESELADDICYQFAGFETYIAIPITVNDKPFGTINFCSFTPRSQPFEEKDIEFIQMMGRWAGVTIERHLAAQLEKEKVIAQASNHAKSEFLAKVSHELRTPLNAIIGYSEILLEDYPEEKHEETNKDLQKINDSANYLLSLINDLLDVSKIEAGKLDLYFETIDIKALVESIAEAIRPLAHKNSNSLEVQYPDNIGNMTGDHLRIRQVLVNILSNATKFTRDGEVTFRTEIETHSDVPYVVFTVADTGIGINAEKIDHLFQDFSQADTEITRKYGGTGLGLSISLRLCRLMKGDIAVASELGLGSTFRIKIPCHASAPPTITLSDKSQCLTELPKASIS